MAVFGNFWHRYIAVDYNSQVILQPTKAYLAAGKAIAFSLLFLLWTASEATAGGYAIPPQTAREAAMGGTDTAGIDTPSAVYANPAALTNIDGNQILGGLTYINTVSGIKNSGVKSRNLHDDDFLPNLFANYHIPDSRITLGIGSYAPFGLATSYKPDSFTRFAAIRSELKTIFVTPAIAWKPFPYLSVGGGVSFVHSSALLSRAIFFGPFGDGRIRVTNTDDGYAYNLGVLVRPMDQLQLGLTFRSNVNLRFDSADVKFIDAPATGGLLTQTKASAIQIPLPRVINFGLHWQVNPQWGLEFEYNFTHWSEFGHLKANFSSPLPGLGGLAPINGFFIPQNWKDTSIVRIGTSYRLNKSLELRGGIGLDETPIPASTLSPVIPGADYLTVTGGIGYTWQKLTIDLGYMAVFYKSRRVNNNVLETGGDPSSLPFPGAPGADKYQTFQNLLGAHLRYRF
jgi:long-chain fatty acid transport protein